MVSISPWTISDDPPNGASAVTILERAMGSIAPLLVPSPDVESKRWRYHGNTEPFGISTLATKMSKPSNDAITKLHIGFVRHCDDCRQLLWLSTLYKDPLSHQRSQSIHRHQTQLRIQSQWLPTHDMNPKMSPLSHWGSLFTSSSVAKPLRTDCTLFSSPTP